MPIAPAVVAAIISAVGSMGAAGINASSNNKKTKKEDKLWDSRPSLGITNGEKANDFLFNSSAYNTEMPGQGRYEQKLDEAYASGVSNAQQSAISSLGATQSAVDLAGKKMEAIRDLGGMFAEYKAQRQDALANWNKQKTENEIQRWDYNFNIPWQIKMNEAAAKKQNRANMASSFLGAGASSASKLIGTQMYTKALQGMGNQGSSGTTQESSGVGDTGD